MATKSMAVAWPSLLYGPWPTVFYQSQAVDLLIKKLTYKNSETGNVTINFCIPNFANYVQILGYNCIGKEVQKIKFSC